MRTEVKNISEQFKGWLRMVAPNTDAASAISVEVDLNTILQLLLQIFTILNQLGCFAAAKVSRETKRVLANGIRQSATALMVIRDDAQFVLNAKLNKRG